VSATVDLEQLAALRALRRTFGDVQVVAVVDSPPASPPAEQRALFEEPSTA
jgi:hypothetical protein